MNWILILFIFFLTSCGFNPVYNSNQDLQQHQNLNSIKIAPIHSIAGAELYYCLTRYLPLKEKPKYLLQVDLVYSSKPQAIQKNSAVFREIIFQSTSYKLLDIENLSLITSGAFYLNSSYNNSFSPYGSYNMHLQTNINLAQSAAMQIKQRLILYFATYNKKVEK